MRPPHVGLPIALLVVLDLTRGRLSDIHHSFALEHRDWKEIIARHRWPPSPRRRLRPSRGSPAWQQRRFAAPRSGLASAAYRAACSAAGSASVATRVVVVPSWRASWLAVGSAERS